MLTPNFNNTESLTAIKISQQYFAELKRNHPTCKVPKETTMLNLNDQIFETLKTTNQYFINLQNRYMLTPHEERIWKQVSKALFTV